MHFIIQNPATPKTLDVDNSVISELYRKLKEMDSKVKVCFITAFETYYEKFKQEFCPLEEIKGFIRKPITNRRLDTIYKPSHKVVWLVRS
jgi:two-component SAPR family response regulator